MKRTKEGFTPSLSRGFTAIEVVIVLAIVVLLGGAYYLNQQNKKTTTPTTTTTITTTTPVATTPSTTTPTVTPTPSPSESQPKVSNAVSDLNLTKLKNMIVLTDVPHNKTLQLKDGTGLIVTTNKAVGAYEFALDDSNIAYGDLNNDGVQDAAVLIGERAGGTGYWYSLHAIINNNGQPKDTAMVGINDDRPIIKSVTISSGAIKVSATTHGPNDTALDPTVETTLNYKLSGSQLVKQ